MGTPAALRPGESPQSSFEKVPSLKVEIWSDVVCPWCYVGKRRFERALESFDHRDDVEVVWRSFELDPTAPAERTEPAVDHLAAKYSVSRDEAQAMHNRMTEAAAADGLTFRFDIARPGNTFDAHRLLHLAGKHGIQDRLKERLLRAYFTEGEPIGDRPTLVRLAGETGLDEGDAEQALTSDAYADEVRRDEARARTYGISGVPFFVVDETYGVSGAQPAPVIAQALETAWAATHPLTLVTAPGDAACDGDVCAT